MSARRVHMDYCESQDGYECSCVPDTEENPRCPFHHKALSYNTTRAVWHCQYADRILGRLVHCEYEVPDSYEHQVSP